MRAKLEAAFDATEIPNSYHLLQWFHQVSQGGEVTLAAIRRLTRTLRHPKGKMEAESFFLKHWENAALNCHHAYLNQQGNYTELKELFLKKQKDLAHYLFYVNGTINTAYGSLHSHKEKEKITLVLKYWDF